MEPPDTTVASLVRERAFALRSRAEHAPFEAARTIAALRSAAQQLSQADDPLGAQLRAQLAENTGLSLPMLEWGLTTTLSSLTHAPLEELVAALPPARLPGELIGVVLAGNVFSAAVRALSLPLLAGAHVIAKAASAEGAMASAWREALVTADPGVGSRLEVVQFSRDAQAASRAFCEHLDALSVYGDDHTVRELASSVGPACRVLEHGHGVSASYVSREHLSSVETALQAAEAVALDVSAYDQRGCLSPQFICVADGGAVTPRAFAELLAERAMPMLAQLLPASTLTLPERAARLQWEAAAAVRGELHARPDYAVSFEGEHSARPSPGGRLVSVYACSELSELAKQLQPYARHLKCIGVAGSRAEREKIAALVASFSTAGICKNGQMQTPAFDARADGRPPFAGLTPEH